jgi:hypothetical protein
MRDYMVAVRRRQRRREQYRKALFRVSQMFLFASAFAFAFYVIPHYL